MALFGQWAEILWDLDEKEASEDRTLQKMSLHSWNLTTPIPKWPLGLVC